MLYYTDMSKRPWQKFLVTSLYLKHPKKYKWVTNPTRGTTLWPNVLHISCKAMFSAYVRPGVHLAEWNRDNVGLSYFVDAHTVHSSSCKLQLYSLLSPPQTSVLPQQSSDVAHPPELLISFSCCVLSMSN